MATKRHRYKSASICEGEIANSKYRPKLLQKADSDDIRHVKKRQEKRQHSKRQLFVDDDKLDMQFCAPSWLNFKFDKIAIMECMP
ncbi:hypothetical protein NQ314_004468 [Rhamnusium bicolor]|uniref:Uncharacterized protein n=1 Tax=Rhamnusium bicolor TaxID=1586634 RepID=A0AAV8ZJY8_9CUCU|nr:hypothetical protein NQ314_004468 [Rhamnusium bicolor]